MGGTNPLHKRKLATSVARTQWTTDGGGFYIEPVQRPDLSRKDVTITVTIPRASYRVLEVIQDDVVGYIDRLIESHVNGLIKSAAINAERKQNGNR